MLKSVLPKAVSMSTSTIAATSKLQRTLDQAFARAGLLESTRVVHSSKGGGRSTKPADPSEPAVAFESRTFSNAAGSREYKLYVPAAYLLRTKSMPLLVMLHGCTQDADDFAAGTRMNQHAEEQGFLVAYPVQPPRANGARCWNWFSPSDQQRGSGEPSLIAGITHQVMADLDVDKDRVFIAGLSAGGAMAVLLGATYPELYAAVGVHSGLPACAANSVPSAMKVMANAQARVSTPASRLGVPTIVFHGDADTTVAVENGMAVSSEATRALSRNSPLTEKHQLCPSDSGLSYSLTTHSDATGVARVETWILHNIGHAWSGGSATGTYTFPAGVDASREMIRFFLEQDGPSLTRSVSRVAPR